MRTASDDATFDPPRVSLSRVGGTGANRPADDAAAGTKYPVRSSTKCATLEVTTSTAPAVESPTMPPLLRVSFGP